jgi:hypothetical protein
MAILFIIPYHALDSIFWLNTTVTQAQKYGDVIFVTDGYVGKVRAEGKQLWIKGFGVGKARDAGVKYGVKNGYDCMIFIDSHMLIRDNIVKLCNYKIAQPRVVAVEGGKFKDDGGGVWGDFLGEWDWHWYYIFYSPSRKDIMATQPSQSISLDVAEAVISANNGWWTQCWYWGKEIFDPTLSATRLGFDVDLVPDVAVAHVYKEGSPKGWKKRFEMRRIDVYEPWYGVVKPLSPYSFSIAYGDAVYALKHYEEHELPRLRLDPQALYVARNNEIMQSLKEFNKNAKYTRRQAYEKLAKYLEGANYALAQ